MAGKPQLQGQLAKKLVAQFPKTSSRTLAKKLYAENPELFASLESARTRIRCYRGNNGNQNRQDTPDKSTFRPNGSAGEPLSMPPSLAEPWEPYLLPAKLKRVLVLSDIHLPYHSPLALSTAVKYGKEQGCDGVILNGDVGDFYSQSRYQKNPKKRDLPGEIDIQRDFLAWLRQEFPKVPIVLKKGNHEERWDHYIWNNAPVLWGLKEVTLEHVLHLVDLKIECVGDQRPLLFRELPVFHGHELGRNGFANPVNMARGAFLRAVHTILVGHGHRTSQHTATDLWHKEITCWSTGCLCDLRPEFARINSWNWGFAILHASNGNWSVENRRISQQGQVW